MALIKCQKCGKEISDRAKKCPHCGMIFSNDKKELTEFMNENNSIINDADSSINIDSLLRQERIKIQKEYEVKFIALEKEKNDAIQEEKKKFVLAEKTNIEKLKQMQKSFSQTEDELRRRLEKEKNDAIQEEKKKFVSAEKAHIEKLKEIQGSSSQDVDEIRRQFEKEYLDRQLEYEKTKNQEFTEASNKLQERIRKEYEDKQAIYEKKRQFEFNKELDIEKKKIDQEYSKQLENERKALLEMAETNTSTNEVSTHKPKGVLIGLGILCMVLFAGNIYQYINASHSNKNKTVTAEQDLESTKESIKETIQPGLDESSTEQTNISNDNSNTEEKTAEVENAVLDYLVCDPGLFENSVTEGQYKCGTDIEAGDYVAISIGTNCSIDIYGNAAKETPISQQYGLVYKVSIEESQFVEIYNGGFLIPFDQFDPDDLQQYGIYKVGEDIPEGEYKIYTKSSSYQISDGSQWSTTSGSYQICNSLLEDGNAGQVEYVSGDYGYTYVKDGQYLILRDAIVQNSSDS